MHNNTINFFGNITNVYFRDPKSRPLAKDLLNHPFITNESESITKTANKRIRRSIQTINHQISRTLEKANQVRVENSKFMLFLTILSCMLLLTFLVAASNRILDIKSCFV